VLVDDGRYAVITQRESYEDIVAREVGEPEWRDA
jgi:hypothetical protein